MAMKLLATNSETNVASSSFTSLIDNSYKLYIFKYFDINPASEGGSQNFAFSASINAGSSYGVTATTTYFGAAHAESNSQSYLSYQTGYDKVQSTDPIPLIFEIGNGSDECAAGTLWLFSPSNTIYTKHFYSITNCLQRSDYSDVGYTCGYFNDTNDIDAIQFANSSGNFDGTIKLYGVGG